MAQPIPFSASPKMAPTNIDRTNIEHLQHAPAEHAEALLAGYELLQLLHDRGVLNLLRGMAGAGEELIAIIAAAVNTPESIRGIRNFLLLTKFYSSIPPDVLSCLINTVSAEAKWERAHKAPSLLSLAGRLRKEDTRHALSVLLNLLEGFGHGLEKAR